MDDKTDTARELRDKTGRRMPTNEMKLAHFHTRRVSNETSAAGLVGEKLIK